MEDLAEIRRYSTLNWGKRVARDYISRIEEALSLIKKNPEILWHEEVFHASLQFYRMKNHLLVFDVQDYDIILLTVLHSSMDIPARLAELQPAFALEVELLRRRLHGK